MNSQQGARLVFNNAKSALMAAGMSQTEVDNAVLSQSYIRLEQYLGTGGSSTATTSTTNQFEFPILVNATGSGQAIRPTEARLSLQDGFYAAGFQLYLAAAAIGASNFQLYMYPNLVTFPNGAPGLYALYNGFMKIVINQSNVITNYPLYRSFQRFQTQQTAAPASGIPQDEFDGTWDQPLEPNILFLGSNNTVITITLPASIGTVDVGTLAVLVFNGVKAQNISTLVS